MSHPSLFLIPLLIACLLLLLIPPVFAFPNISRVYGCYDLSDGSTVQCYSGQNVTILLSSYDRLQCTTNVTVRLGDRWNCLYPAANSLWGFSCMVPSLPVDALNQTLPVKVVCGNESTPWFMGLRSWGELAITRVSGCSTDNPDHTTSGCMTGSNVTIHGQLTPAHTHRQPLIPPLPYRQLIETPSSSDALRLRFWLRRTQLHPSDAG